MTPFANFFRKWEKIDYYRHGFEDGYMLSMWKTKFLKEHTIEDMSIESNQRKYIMIFNELNVNRQEL